MRYKRRKREKGIQLLVKLDSCGRTAVSILSGMNSFSRTESSCEEREKRGKKEFTDLAEISIRPSW